MIHLERGPAPAVFSSDGFRRYRAELESFFTTPRPRRAQRRFAFAPLHEVGEVMGALREAFYGKCAYCENRPDAISLELESFRPRLRAVGLQGDVAEDHYYWLAYEWENLLASCTICNRQKASRFPINGERARPGVLGEELDRERPLLLDPCRDRPESHLVYDAGIVASPSEEGQTTIAVLNLNRPALVEARQAAMAEARIGWEVFLRATTRGVALEPEAARLAALLDPNLSHLGPRRQVLAQASQELVARRPDLELTLRPFLRLTTPATGFTDYLRMKASSFSQFRQLQVDRESYSVEDEGRKEDYYLNTRWIERVEIENFKVLRQLELAFPPPGEKGPFLMLLGENGTGKSSVLKALALTLMGRDHHDRLGLDASTYVTHGEDRGSVKVYLTGTPEPIELSFRRGERRFGLEPENPQVLLLGYGATRLLPRPGTRPVERFGASKTDNLFNPFVPLGDANRWLAERPPVEFDRMALGLKRLLVLDEDAELKAVPGPSPVVTIQDGAASIPLLELSDGYQSIVALAVDIMSVLRLRWPDMELAEGIVLIDEIDAHLHPRWKMQVVERLRQVFPRVQFVMTTHDPLCLCGLEAREVAVLRKGADGWVGALRDLPSPAAMRVEQILTSELFGLISTRSPDEELLFQEYYRLLAVRDPDVAQRSRLAELKRQLAGRDLMGTTLRERLVLEAADRFLAETEDDPGGRRDLKEETLRKIAEIWAAAGSGKGSRP